jgi:hypothetical protein
MISECKKGSDCDFIHDNNLCKHYFQGRCKFDDKCKNSHDFEPMPTPKTKITKKNTHSFVPDLNEPDIRFLIQSPSEKFEGDIKENDVVVLPDFFKDINNETMYNILLKEIEDSGIPSEELWKQWHGDTHTIADDRLEKKTGIDWKKKCPTYNMIIEKMKEYFNMEVKETRFNKYKDNTEWKPYHRDASVVDEKKESAQTFTVGISFGATRTVSFQHGKTRSRIDVPLTDGSVYTFSKQVNVNWKHGIIQEPELAKDGRISIIIWGDRK